MDIQASFGAQALNKTSETSKTAAAQDELRQSAKQFEAVFVKQMLQYAGLGEAFGAGKDSGAEAFSDFVLDRIAEQMVEQGGFGLADDIYERLKVMQSEAETVPTQDIRV